MSNSPLRVRMLAATPQAAQMAAAATTTSTTYTGAGTDKYNGVPIYYHLTVTNTNNTSLTFVYTVTYDNPETTAVEKPSLGSNTVTMNTWGTATVPMITLGKGYGTPTNVQSGLSTWDAPTKFLTTPRPTDNQMTKNGNGYSWPYTTITSTNTG